MQVFDATVTIDTRERALIRSLDEHGASGYIVRSLPLGDVQCTYYDGTGWLLERKTAHDFAASICDGRYFEQRSRLYNENDFKVVFVIEGDLQLSVMHKHMLSSIVGVERNGRAQIYRTWNVTETVELIGVLVAKLQLSRISLDTSPSGIAPPKTTLSKRKRESSPRTVFKRMLMCIPSISESIAGRLVDEFGSMSNLQHALANESPFRHITLSRGKLGSVRVKRLKQHLAVTSA